MSRIDSTKCDTCGAVTDRSAFSLPDPWVSVEVKAKGGWYETKAMHACSKECAARLFYKLADECGGIPNAGHPLIDSPKGQPYR